MKNDLIRRDTAKHYKEVRRVLKYVNPPEIVEQDDEKFSKNCLAIIILLIALGIMCLFAGCAAAQELTASWYSVESLKQEGTWAYSHGIMVNGKEFKDENLTCATRLWPLGSILIITNNKSHKRVTVRVTDRIGKRFASKRIDLSVGAFKRIANIKQGLIKVKIERIK